MKTLTMDCNYKTVMTEQYKTESIWDAFINGISSSTIKHRLDECKLLSLSDTFNLACSLDTLPKGALIFIIK